jgi:hypothetical protein
MRFPKTPIVDCGDGSVGYSAKIAYSIVIATAMAAASPAVAEVETFASYTQATPGSSLHWAKTPSGGSLYTSVNGATAAPIAVNFTYLTSALSSLGPLASSFTMNLTAADGNPAFSGGGFLVQGGLTGSFSFTYTGADFTIGSTTYSSGTNLLSGTIGEASIAGAAGGTSGGVSASTSTGSVISYASDVLNFADGSTYDFALTLTQISQVLNRPSSTSSLRDFDAASTGSFSADPAPTTIGGAVPEPATWGMMLIGFGVIGGALRARKRGEVNARIRAA